jgi:multiple sugar transport system ATP-binding protein
MDEPLSNLDAKLRVQTRAELIQLQRRLQTTVVYVTHDQVEAMTMGHRIAIMSAGVLQQVGPPGEVYARPANVFVAGFIGNPPMNLLDGTVEVLGDTLAVTVDGTQLVLPASLAAQVVAADVTDVVVGVRPEDLSVDPSASLRATVAVVESLGHERHLVGERADGSLITVRIQGDDPLPDVGHEVGLAVDARAVHVFDRTTGRRIGP